MKKYISHSDIAFNILVEGKRRQISFEPVTSGGSHYFCNDNKICGLIEKADGFGRLFYLDKTFGQKASLPIAAPMIPLMPEVKPIEPITPEAVKDQEETPPIVPVVDTENPAPEVASIEPTDDETELPESDIITPEVPPTALAAKEYPEVTTFSEAKDVLVTLGALSSVLRSKETVAKAAEELGISFPNLK